METRPSTWWPNNAKVGTGQVNRLSGQWSGTPSAEVVHVECDASPAMPDASTQPAVVSDDLFSDVQMCFLVSASDPTTTGQVTQVTTVQKLAIEGDHDQSNA